MGPPSRPNDENSRVNVNDISDVLTGAGVDEKEEEAALLSQQTVEGAQRTNGISFHSDLAGSFNSAGISRGDYFGSQNSYSNLSQNVPGDRASFYGAGTFNQAPVSQEALEREHNRKIRERAEKQQHHMANPFLQGHPLVQRIHGKVNSLQVTLPRENTVTTAANKDPVRMNVPGPDGRDNIMLLRGQDLLIPQASMTQLCSLLSLAAKDRMRAVVEDSATLAKGRRVGSHGVVPPELADIAIGVGKPEETTLTPDSSGNGKKRKRLISPQVFNIMANPYQAPSLRWTPAVPSSPTLIRPPKP